MILRAEEHAQETSENVNTGQQTFTDTDASKSRNFVKYVAEYDAGAGSM
jgi:hypothetical protein